MKETCKLHSILLSPGTIFLAYCKMQSQNTLNRTTFLLLFVFCYPQWIQSGQANGQGVMVSTKGSTHTMFCCISTPAHIVCACVKYPVIYSQAPEVLISNLLLSDIFDILCRQCPQALFSPHIKRARGQRAALGLGGIYSHITYSVMKLWSQKHIVALKSTDVGHKNSPLSEDSTDEVDTSLPRTCA